MFVEKLATIFAALLQHWREQGVAPILREWQHHAHPLHTPLQANLPDGNRMNGEYEGLSEDGALKLRLADGSIHAIHAADVFLV